jgi:hypothetical protein
LQFEHKLLSVADALGIVDRQLRERQTAEASKGIYCLVNEGMGSPGMAAQHPRRLYSYSHTSLPFQ